MEGAAFFAERWAFCEFPERRGSFLSSAMATRESIMKAAIESLRILERDNLRPENVEAYEQLYKAVGPEMPAGLVAQPVNCKLPEGVDAEYASKFNFDEGHGGRFTLFDCEGASLDPKAVLDKPDPLGYVRGTLSYGDVDAGECVVFVPVSFHSPTQVHANLQQLCINPSDENAYTSLSLFRTRV